MTINKKLLLINQKINEIHEYFMNYQQEHNITPELALFYQQYFDNFIINHTYYLPANSTKNILKNFDIETELQVLLDNYLIYNITNMPRGDLSKFLEKKATFHNDFFYMVDRTSLNKFKARKGL